MRHVLANLATYLIAAMLLLGVVAFAWARSAQLEISDEKTIWAQYDSEAENAFPWFKAGAASYLSNCANCHGRDGRGWDQYPALEHTSRLFQAPQGRDYVVDVHLYGLTSSRWRAPMPPMGHMQDPELAAVMNYVLLSFGNEEHLSNAVRFVRPQDIRARRGAKLRPHEVNERRPRVGLAGRRN